MILALDVGNSQIYGGLFDAGRLALSFRTASGTSATSDELGLFLRSALRENGWDPAVVDQVAICTVVPDVVYSLRSCCRKYFAVDPFVLQAGVKTGLKIRYRNPLEVGPDRIANAIGATHRFPDENLIVVDFGTATTFDVVRAGREYLGGIIMPGLRVAMEALEKNTARLPKVEIVPPPGVVGRSTVEGIQSGLFFGNRAVVRELAREIRAEAFRGEKAVVIGTGGFARLFEREQIFDVLIPDLVLVGLERALALNDGASRRWQPEGEAGIARSLPAED